MMFGFGFAAGKGNVPVDEQRNFALGVSGFRFGDLFEPERLAALDTAFRADLNGLDGGLAQRFEAYRAGAALSPPEESALLIAVARPLGQFVAQLFGVESEHQALLDRALREKVVFELKNFIKRRATSKYPEHSLPSESAPEIHAAVVRSCATRFPELVLPDDEELTIAAALSRLLAEEAAAKRDAQGVPPTLAAELDLFERWGSAHQLVPRSKKYAAFRFPHHVEFENLVPLRRPDSALPEITEGLSADRRRRDGFALTDQRMSPRE